MELKTLRYFIAVAEELNITHAAQKLNMSQPPLTLQIRRLEEELGVTLFIRGKRRLTLTQEGSLFLRRARELLDLEQKTLSEMQAAGSGLKGTVYLGLVEGRPPYLAAAWMKQLRAQYPDVDYSLWNGSSDDVIYRLEKGLLDAAIIASPFDNEKLDSVRVWEEPWVAVIPGDHPLAASPSHHIRLRQLASCPLIVPARASRVEGIRRWFESVGETPRIFARTSNYIDALAMSEQGLGICIFPQTNDMPNDLVVRKVITNPPRKVAYHLVWLRSRACPALTQMLIDYVKSGPDITLSHASHALVSSRIPDRFEEIEEL